MTDLKFQQLKCALERRYPTTNWMATHNDQQQVVHVDGGVGIFFVASGLFQVSGVGIGRQALQVIKDDLENPQESSPTSPLTDSQWTEASVRFSALHTENKALNARVVDLEERIDEIWQHLQLHGWCAETHLGDSIHAIGSLPELGEWDQRGIVSLATGDGVFPTWTGSVWLPASQKFEFKFVKRCADGSVQFEQFTGNRVALVTGGEAKLQCGTFGVLSATAASKVAAFAFDDAMPVRVHTFVDRAQIAAMDRANNCDFAW